MFDNNAFPKQFRLLKENQFQQVLSKEQSVLGKYYVCYYLSNELLYSRLGIIVAKKKCRLAITRNRIRRQIRESFRHFQSKLPGYDIVMVARQAAQAASKFELRQCLDNLFLKLIA